MCSLMHSELRLSTEGFPTFSALIGLLPCMSSLMNCEGRLLAEDFGTFYTLIQFLPCMSSFRHCDLRLAFEDYFSLFINIWPLNFTSYLMLKEICPAVMSVVFYVLIRLFTCTCSLVFNDI